MTAQQMKCPSCQTGRLQPASLETLFSCQTCNSCGGSWVLLEDYFRWKASKPEEQNESADIDIIESADTKKTLICPVTGKLMLKYRISTESDCRLDLSPYANAIWLDQGEWLLLKKLGLTTQLNRIFTDPWQKKIRTTTSKEALEQVYREKLGDKDYDKIKEIRNWLASHPHADFLKAFMIADKSSW